MRKGEVGQLDANAVCHCTAAAAGSVLTQK